MPSSPARADRRAASPLAIAVLLSVFVHVAVLVTAGRLPLRVQPAGGDARPRRLSVLLESARPRIEAAARRPRMRAAAAPRRARQRGNQALGTVFYAGSELQRRPVPVSAPDIRRSTHLDAEFGMARLVLFIDASGHVVRIRVASSHGFSARDLHRLRDLFVATRFFPGYRNAAPVASRIDIRIRVAPLALQLHRLSTTPARPRPARAGS